MTGEAMQKAAGTSGTIPAATNLSTVHNLAQSPVDVIRIPVCGLKVATVRGAFLSFLLKEEYTACWLLPKDARQGLLKTNLFAEHTGKKDTCELNIQFSNFTSQNFIFGLSITFR